MALTRPPGVWRSVSGVLVSQGVDVKSKGQIAYEQDVKKCPMYPGNHGPRPAWDDLPEIAKWSWERE